MTSHFQDGGHDVSPPLLLHMQQTAESASPPSACDVIGSLCIRCRTCPDSLL